jgi:hypothetical protein
VGIDVDRQTDRQAGIGIGRKIKVNRQKERKAER